MIQFFAVPYDLYCCCSTSAMRTLRFFYRMDEKAPMGLPDDNWGGSYQSIQVRAFSSW